MSPRPEFILLCRLLDGALRPFSHLGAEPLTKESGKELLISLSQVFTQVNKWTHQFGTQSKFDIDEELELCDIGEFLVPATSYSDNFHCLAKIIVDLVFLFAVNNPYAPHSAGNTFVAISKFLIASGSGSETFMHLLCLFLESTIDCTFALLHLHVRLVHWRKKFKSWLVNTTHQNTDSGCILSSEVMRGKSLLVCNLNDAFFYLSECLEIIC